MNKMFNPITPIRAWCYKVLPQVYDDSLSYYELLCKIKNAVNELIATNNELPDYIRQIILDYLSSGEIGKIVADMLAEFILNVKFPPTGLKPASGDGSEDDTEAIQGCIDYAFNNGGMAVYFPNGVYLTNSLTLKDGVSLVGAGRYNTRLVLKGGATQPLIIGNSINNEISNLSLDGNADIQVNNLNLIELNGSNYLFENLILNDGYELLHLLTTAGHTQLNNIVFKKATIKHLFVNGLATVQANSLEFENLSALNGETCIDNNTDNAMFTNISCFATTPLALINTGDYCLFELNVKNALNDYIDTGSNNIIKIVGKSIKETLSGNKTIKANNKIEELTGNKSLKANDVIEDLTGDKFVKAVNSKEVLTENKEMQAVNLNEELTGSKNISAVNLTENLTGDKSLKVNDYTENITGTKNINSVDVNYEVEQNYNVNADISVENIADKKEINSNDIILNPLNPLTYKAPTIINEYFKKIPFKDINGINYNVLVENEELPDIGKNNLNIVNVLDYGAKCDGINDDTIYIRNAILNCKTDDTLLIPYDTLITDTINIPYNINVKCDGYIIADFTVKNKPAIIVGDTNNIGMNRILRISVREKTITAHASSLFVGIELINVTRSMLYITVDGFYIGCEFVGHGQGNVFNTTFLYNITNNNIGLKLNALANGWVNDNLFFNGSFTYWTSNKDYFTETIGIQITSDDGTYNNNNNNMFIKPSFEYMQASNIGINVNGSENTFEEIRNESACTTFIKCENNSQFNYFKSGYGNITTKFIQHALNTYVDVWSYKPLPLLYYYKFSPINTYFIEVDPANWFKLYNDVLFTTNSYSGANPQNMISKKGIKANAQISITNINNNEFEILFRVNPLATNYDGRWFIQAFDENNVNMSDVANFDFPSFNKGVVYGTGETRYLQSGARALKGRFKVNNSNIKKIIMGFNNISNCELNQMIVLADDIEGSRNLIVERNELIRAENKKIIGVNDKGFIFPNNNVTELTDSEGTYIISGYINMTTPTNDGQILTLKPIKNYETLTITPPTP